MSRTAKTHVRHHGKDRLELLSDSGTPLMQQAKAFKLLRGQEVHEKFAELHYQESDGPLRVVRFITPDEKKAREEAGVKSAAAAKEHADKVEKEKARAANEKNKKLATVEKANTEADRKAREEAKKSK